MSRPESSARPRTAHRMLAWRPVLTLSLPRISLLPRTPLQLRTLLLPRILSLPQLLLLPLTLLLLTTLLTACQRHDAAALIAQAAGYRDQGNTAAAVLQLKSALQQDGANRHARLLLGQVYLEHGDPVLAEKELRRAAVLGADPQHVPLLLGKALLMQGKYAEVLAATLPDARARTRAAALALRATAMVGLGKRDAARTLFVDALAVQANLPEALIGMARLALAEGRSADAGTLATRALAAEPDNIDSLRFQADLLRAQGKMDAALAAYQRIAVLRPQQARALLDLANLHIDAGRLGQARLAIAAARKLSGPTVALVYAEAVLHYRENKLPAALQSLQQVLGTAPDYAPAILLAGAVQSALGATEQAAAHLEKFMVLHPGHLYASKLICALKIRAGDNAAALALLQPLLADYPSDPELLTLAGEAQLQARAYDAAAALFERASELRPDTSALHAALGLSRLGNGEQSRAIVELERAAALDRGAARTGILLVMTQLRAQTPDKALATVLAMEQAGDNPLVQNLKGGVLLAKHDAAGARACFNRALALEPLYLPALANLAQLDLREQQPLQARKRYQAALARAPRNAALMSALSRLALDQGDLPGALAWLEHAWQAEPGSLVLGLRLADLNVRSGQLRKAVGLARSLEASFPTSPEAQAMLAQALAMSGDLPGAIDSYAKLALLAPRSPVPHVRMASLFLAQKDPAATLQALAALRKALALDPDRLDVQLSMLTTLIGQKRYPEAQALAASVQRRQPQAPQGYKLEGDLLAAQGRHGAALALYERAFSLGGGSAVLVQLHGLLSTLGRTQEADKRLAEWLRIHPTDLPARMYLASSKLVRQEYQAAIEHLEAALKIEPDNVVVLNDLAWACQRNGDQGALAYAERAFALAPSSPSVMDTLGWIHLERGNLPRALPLLQKASALAPHASEIRFHFGMVLARSGDRKGARRELEKLLASQSPFPHRAEAAALLASL